jgi:hypothetical protein
MGSILARWHDRFVRKLIMIFVLLVGAQVAHADDGERWDGLTIAEQTGGAVLGGALGAGAGVMLGAGLAKDDGWGALGAAALGGVVGCVAGVTVGVKLAGDHRDGTGTWGGTIAGGVGGGLLTLVTVSQLGEKLPSWAAISLATVTLVAPAIVGYHLSADDDPSTESRVMFPILTSPF